MSDLISREAMIKRLQEWNRNDAMDKALYDFVMNRIIEQPTIKAVPLNEIYRLIAGHSDYHGDNILAALTCVAEGKKVTPVRPIEAVPVVHGFNDNRNYHECDEFRCSECGLHLEDWNRHVYDEELDDEFIKEYVFKYCPECGAKIGGAE